MTEEEIVSDIKACVDRLNWLSRLAAEKKITFALDSSMQENPTVGVFFRHTTATITKRL